MGACCGEGFRGLLRLVSCAGGAHGGAHGGGRSGWNFLRGL